MFDIQLHIRFKLYYSFSYISWKPFYGIMGLEKNTSMKHQIKEYIRQECFEEESVKVHSSLEAFMFLYNTALSVKTEPA